jgi:hypothetical protein
MDPKEIRKQAIELAAQAKAVLRAYPQDSELGKVALTDPARRAESFATRYDELSWYDLIIFHITTRRAKQGDVAAFCELPRQLRIIEREYCS